MMVLKAMSVGWRSRFEYLLNAPRRRFDPVLERDRDRRGIPAFEQATEAAYADLKSKWKPRQQEAFLSSSRRHAYPVFAKRRVDQIAAADIQEALKPIWTEKAGISRKVGSGSE